MEKNITSNVIPAEFLWSYIPWFVIPIGLGVLSDALITQKIKISKWGENVAGAIMGSIFLVYSMPLIGMTYVQFYVFTGVSGYELLPEFSETLLMILGIMSMPGAIMGWLSTSLARNKISIPIESVV